MLPSGDSLLSVIFLCALRFYTIHSAVMWRVLLQPPEVVPLSHHDSVYRVAPLLPRYHHWDRRHHEGGWKSRPGLGGLV